jgi:hypothetical protein
LSDRPQARALSVRIKPGTIAYIPDGEFARLRVYCGGPKLTYRGLGAVRMPVIFVLEEAGGVPSSLISRLVDEGYHTLSLRDANETLSTLQCVRPNLLIIDATHGHAGQDAAGLLDSLRQDPTYGSLPVLVVGDGAATSPDAVIDRVRACVEPMSAPYN